MTTYPLLSIITFLPIVAGLILALFLRGNDEAEIRRLSEAAFATVPEPRKPVARLAELAGVGPATASAALAARHPDLDRGARAVCGETVTRRTLSHIVLPRHPAETVAVQIARVGAAVARTPR